ncbi:MAG: sel1 repeat family protein [Desulfobulbaceae bacterium]|nr:sel1 repeat family protein [Desulfobulbaceae bacterium]
MESSLFLALYNILCFFVGLEQWEPSPLFDGMAKIASSGNPEAQYHLGMFYNNGIGTSKNIAKAFEMFQKSSAGGNPLGSYKLGCYYSGQGKGVVKNDQNKGLKYKLIAAEAGYVRAQQDVAAKYFNDNDIQKAISWWEQAANQGYPSAFYSLFAVYYDEKFNTKDWAKAYQYLKIIERNVDEDKKQKVAEKI